MEQIAWIIGHTYIYWSAVIRTLAVCASVCAFWALYLKKREKAVAAFLCVPLSVAFSLILSRVSHWYFRPDSYGSLQAALNPLLPGDNALMGVFAGCFLAAVVLCLIRVTDNLPELLDCMCLAGGLGIALGRLASLFNASDRGMVMPARFGFPWVCAVINPVTGMAEYRLATFLLQAIAAGMITLVLLVFYLAGQKRGESRDGDIALLFMLCYGASQVVLDSTRYDALYFKSNGFISVVQVLGAAAIALPVICFAVRLVRAGGWKKWYGFLWLLQAACFGLTGYMEYHVQRHGAEAVFAYSVMGISLAVMLLLTLATRRLAAKEEKQHTQWLMQISGSKEAGRSWRQ